jgi:hypothetical protein
MKEIKFRAWTGKNMQYSEIPPSFAFWKYIAYDSECLKTLMQFTGLRDKNGKEIYEGDIVMVGGSSEPKVMEFLVGDFVAGKIYGGAEAYRMEVIGNIWETPELLTV